MKLWTQQQAIALCTSIEAIGPKFGCHVGLTGGCLYKGGHRKDLDIIFYRIREASKIDDEKLFGALATIGIVKDSGFGWCVKAQYEGKKIDCFFPEEIGGEYVHEAIDPADKLTSGDLLNF